MKKKILSVMLTVTLILSFGLMAAPVAAATPGPPTIDGVASFTEWQEATVIQVADSMGTIKVVAYPDYLYMLFVVQDTTDNRFEEGYGNDKIGVNINPTAGELYGKPCDIIFEMGTDPASWSGSGPTCGLIDGYETNWVIDGVQVIGLPNDLEATTLFGDGTRVTELKIPMVVESMAPAGGSLTLGGVCDNLANSGNSYKYPPTLDWGEVAPYAVIPVQGATSVGAVTVVPEDLIQISVTPTLLAFGEVYRGQSSDLIPMEIANTGSVPVLVSTSTGSAFYQVALTIDGVLVGTWNDTITSPGSIHPEAQVTVPSNWASGTESGTIIFWAEAIQ